jgi:dynein light chain LC8-type
LGEERKHLKQVRAGADEKLERRSRYLSSLVRRTSPGDPPQPKLKVEHKRAMEPSGGEGKAGKAEVKEREVKVKEDAAGGEGRKVAVRVRATDLPLALQRRAIWAAWGVVLSTPRLESKRLALALKKVPAPAGFFFFFFPFEFVFQPWSR